MAEDAAERTEPPTPKKIEDTRKKGEVANSRDISSVVVLAAGFLALGSFGGSAFIEAIGQQARAAWGGSNIHPASIADYHALLLTYGASSAKGWLPTALFLMAAGFAISFVQTGPLFSGQALAFKGSRISPLQGVKRLFSQERMFDLAKTPLKLGVVGTAIVAVFAVSLDPILGLTLAEPAATLEMMRSLIARTLGIALFGLSVLAIGDFGYVRVRHTKKLRMSLKEVRDEMRDRDGSPHVRSRRKQIQRELSRHRMIADAASADLVLTNPTHVAVALRYVRGEMAAPTVVAKGRGHLAARIRKAARQNDVPIVENPPLARLLYKATRVGREIPESLFEAVAEVLAMIYRLDQRRGGAWGSSG